ncbi:hypothetical protein B0H67DRAFT_676174 [Lasiosphaeris hirsuta]|uniref:Galactose oxidase n=1 Tax=Lasiosphaeris hirsuta TaxID=260670 RepID=A0AA39ZR53_9PEZI|nr:hypothetical protein B0H67DRAFT_676174 [Lasiosphaeris hirsuta]
MKREHGGMGDMATATVFSNGTGYTLAAIYGLKSGTVVARNVSATHHNMFCPGLSLDMSGRRVITGGSSPHETSIYDTTQDSWITGPEMKTGRGYHTQTTLSDGGIFTIGGSWSGGAGKKDAEVLDSRGGSWGPLSTSSVEPMLTNDSLGLFAADNHAWLFAWKGGSVFQAGPSAYELVRIQAQGRQASAGTRGMDGDSMDGNAVMDDVIGGKILILRGALSYSDCPSTRAAHIITISKPFDAPTVEEIAPMGYARAYANSVVLPTGDVFITGGASYAKQWTDANATWMPELWSSKTGKFTRLAPMPIPRTYHSVAVLLPGATVLTGGGGLCWDTCRGHEKEINHMDVQVYTSPYLFKGLGDGVLAARPVVLGVSNTYYTPFSLVRYGSATHVMNTDQRRIRLDPTVSDINTRGDRPLLGRGRYWMGFGGKPTHYKVSIPDDAGIVIPGYWMLFAISLDGAPSNAETILIEL